MPRASDIQTAYVEAVRLNPKDYLYLITDNFIS